MNMKTSNHLLIPCSWAEVNLFDDTFDRVLVNRVAFEPTNENNHSAVRANASTFSNQCVKAVIHGVFSKTKKE